MVAEGIEAKAAHDGERGRRDEAVDAAAEENAAQELLLAALDVFRDEANDRRLEAEAGDPAENHRADPDDDEDAILEIAHPAREQHLRDVGD